MEATPTVDSSEASKEVTAERKNSENADKHENVHSKPSKGRPVTIINAFEKQEKLRQKMEDLLDEQG